MASASSTNSPTHEGPFGNDHPPDLNTENTFSARLHYEDTSLSVFSPSSPLSEIESDPENALSLLGPVGAALTAAERAREKKLRDDPMAIVLGPLFVDCKRCGARIKLSSKSQYDTLHWRTHRARCLKRQHRQPKKSGSGNAPVPSPPPPHPLEKPLPPLEISATPATPTKERSRDNSVPAATRSSSSSPSFSSRVRAADTIFEEYLLRSNRKRIRYTSPQPAIHWKDWTWDQLLLPKFVREPDSDEADLTTGNNATLIPTHPALPFLPLPRPA